MNAMWRSVMPILIMKRRGKKNMSSWGLAISWGCGGLVNEQGLVSGVDAGVQTVQPSMPAVFPLQVPNPVLQCEALVLRRATSWSEIQTEEQKRLREGYISQLQGKVFSCLHTCVEPSHEAIPIPKP